MTFFGVYLLAFLNLLPKRLDWELIATEAFADLTKGITLLFNTLVTAGAGLLILVLIALGLLLLIGGLWRIVIVVSKILSKSKSKSKKRSSKGRLS